ncbi:hypothetical protein GCM10007907_37010 [Chitinimonas prasina]|uniref:Transcriptional regulator n=1 Tax=Chitinimonas prasina TaxID=1434937 RepID=A0ABQ5YNK1_9NEIS|nr:hypothetical protein [Chitinimonas prasina]GLR14911.1 hypothetical protein GCM10007907_37010 [Chitinimonas prasina]
MSKVTLFIRDFGPKKIEAIGAIREKLGIGLSLINQSFANGTPLLERAIFDRNNPDFPNQLLDLIRRLDALQVGYVAFEILDNQTFSLPGKYYEITFDRLTQMIEAREKSVEQQRNIGELQDGMP